MMFRVAVASVFVASSAWATTQVAATLDSLTKGADAIVHGTVIESHARKTLDGMRIITDTRIAVEESHKGEVGAEVVVMQPGGVVGDVGQRVEGTARFSEGEEVVVFLEKRGTRFTMRGMAQGKFTVDRSGTKPLAVPNADHAGLLVDPQTHQEVATPLAPLALDELKSRITKTLKAGPAAPAKTP